MKREYTQEEIQEMLDVVPVPQEYTDWIDTVIDAYVLAKGDIQFAHVVESWSSRGEKYQPGEVLTRWSGFSETGGRNGGGLINKALAAGWSSRNGQQTATQAPKAPPSPRGQVVPRQNAPAPLPPLYSGYREAERTLYGGMDHAAQRRAFISALYSRGEFINIAWDGIQDERGKYRPAGDLSAVNVGGILDGTGPNVLDHEAYNHDSGVWIRANPVCEHPTGKNGSGTAVADTDITAFRYALIESDTMPEAEQLRIFDQMRLPAAAIVLSGGKSVHAVVKIQANSQEQFKARVERLHAFCKTYGVPVDANNKNPSRFMRLPGVTRAGREQVLLDIGSGCRSWEEFEEFMEDAIDGLPPTVALEEVTGDHLPPKRPELISGVLRCGHIMMLSGGSKSGKSFLLAELVLAVAAGGAWLGRKCKKGRILYINMEIDSPSMAHRFQAIEDSAKISPGDIAGNIEVWNLRGISTTFPQIVDSIERKARHRAYDLVIVDPLYKVLGNLDENAAGDVGQLFSMFDRIAATTGAAVVFCHHHSKGGQAGKTSMDRASGSGVFARSPDAILDVLELETTPDTIIKAGLSLAGIKPVGLSYNWTLREFAPVDEETGFFIYPLHAPDVHNVLRGARTAKEAQAAEARRKNLNKNIYWGELVNTCFEDLAAADVSGDGVVRAEDLINAVMNRAGTDSMEHAEKKIRDSGFIFRRAAPAAGKPRTVERKPEENDAE